MEVVGTAQAAFSQSLSTALSKFGRAESCETTSAGTERLLREQAIVDANSSQASGQQRDSSALAGLTTVMVKNVPVKYTQRKLLREILNAGFQGKMDFIYLPMDPRNRCARGFAFCNFTTPEAAQQFFRTYHKSHLKSFDSDQPLEVMAAEIQGFEANAEHYLVVKASRKEKGRDTLGCPTFLRPLPRVVPTQATLQQPPVRVRQGHGRHQSWRGQNLRRSQSQSQQAPRFGRRNPAGRFHVSVAAEG